MLIFATNLKKLILPLSVVQLWRLCYKRAYAVLFLFDPSLQSISRMKYSNYPQVFKLQVPCVCVLVYLCHFS